MVLLEFEEHSLLPAGKVLKTHNLCAILFDQLQEIMTSEIYEGLARTDFALEGLPGINEKLDTEQLLEILTQNGRKSEVVDIIAKHITRSILGDFVQFIYESLDAMRNARFSVAYTLLRKPFVDELLMFEQILVDKTDFVQRYYFQGNINLYDPSNGNRFDKIKKSIIESAVNKLRYPGDYKVDILYDYRYEKSAKYGMNWVSNQAIHIVTTDSRYRTLDRELNFVFINDADRLSMWEHYYSVVLYLLHYTVDIVDEIVFGFLPKQKCRQYIKATKRAVISAYYSSILSENEERVDELTAILAAELEHICKNCGNTVEFGSDRFQSFVLSEELLCSNCGTNQLTDPDFQNKFLALG